MVSLDIDKGHMIYDLLSICACSSVYERFLATRLSLKYLLTYFKPYPIAESILAKLKPWLFSSSRK